MCPYCGQSMWHKSKGFGKGKETNKGKSMRPSKRWKVLAPKVEGKGEGKGKQERREYEALLALEVARLEWEARARARAEYLRSMNPWRWILMD